MSKSQISIVVADDHVIMRRGLVALLSATEGVRVVGEASDGREALALAKDLLPDIILMDVGMPNLNGVEATRQIKADLPEVKVLVLSGYDNEQCVRSVLDSGADGYLVKSTEPGELQKAIRAVCSGKRFLSASVEKLLDGKSKLHGGRRPHPETNVSTRSSKLTRREREILQLVAEGRAHKEIANMLHLSVRTVDTHRNNIMKKLDVHETAGLVNYAIKHGIVFLPE